MLVLQNPLDSMTCNLLHGSWNIQVVWDRRGMYPLPHTQSAHFKSYRKLAIVITKYECEVAGKNEESLK